MKTCIKNMETNVSIKCNFLTLMKMLADNIVSDKKAIVLWSKDIYKNFTPVAYLESKNGEIVFKQTSYDKPLVSFGPNGVTTYIKLTSADEDVIAVALKLREKFRSATLNVGSVENISAMFLSTVAELGLYYTYSGSSMLTLGDLEKQDRVRYKQPTFTRSVALNRFEESID